MSEEIITTIFDVSARAQKQAEVMGANEIQPQQEAIAAQSANVNGVTGATASSDAFVQSLSSALKQAT